MIKPIIGIENVIEDYQKRKDMNSLTKKQRMYN